MPADSMLPTLTVTDAQAKLKAVWEHPNIASICTEMPNMTQLMSNVAAAMNRTKLSAREVDLLRQYARETRSDCCSGCTAMLVPVWAES